MSTITKTEESAIQLARVSKSYGFHKNKIPVLKGVDLNVPKGCVFSLLGPSGCGKTTLLKCIIGRVKIDSGSINVFGRSLQSPRCNIPGSGVGYMPQELALCDYLTANETLTFYARLHDMNADRTKIRINFLLDFLRLPNERNLVKNLSGGQKRRVSLAIALLHEPPLLVLDEPTVGVDPILRQKIWSYLRDISELETVTTLITTHYVEETARAHKIALMRNGKISAVGKPEAFTRNFGCSTLEATILKLCYEEDSAGTSKSVMYRETNVDDDPKYPLIGFQDANSFFPKKSSSFADDEKKLTISFPSARRIYSLTVKNFTTVRRKLFSLTLQLIIPTIYVAMFFLVTRGTPNHLDVAVVNEDFDLGNKFISYIDNNTVHRIPMDDLDLAKKELEDGRIWGWIHIWPNYSASLFQRFLTSSVGLSDDVVNASTIHVRLEYSDLYVFRALKLEIINSFQDFIEKTQIELGIQPQNTGSFLEFDEQVHIPESKIYFEFTIPGQIVLMVYCIVIGLTVIDCTDEINDGLLDRNYVAGAGNFELMFGRAIVEFIVLFGQVTLVVFSLVFVLDFPCRGHVAWVILLVILQGVCGMAFGNLISAVFQEQFTALSVALGTIFGSMMLSGSLSPVEGMPDVIKKLTPFLPHTDAIRGLRSILSRGRGFWYFTVQRGICASVLWIIVCMILTMFTLRIRR